MLAGRRLSIRTKLIAIYLIIAVPLITLLGISIYQRFKADQDSAIADRLEIARLSEANFVLFIDQTAHSALLAGDTIVDDKLNPNQASALLTRIVTSRHTFEVVKGHPTPIASASFLNANGIVVASSIASEIGQNRSSQPAIKAIINGKSSSISNLQRNLDGSLGFAIVLAIKRGGILLGIVSIAVRAEALGDILGIAVRQGGVNIVDSNGFVIFQSQAPKLPLEKRNWSHEKFVQVALAGRTFTSTGLVFPLDNSIRMGAEIPIKSIGWATGSFIPVNAVLGPIREAAILNTILALIILTIALSLAFIIGSQFARSLILLSNQMKIAPQKGFTERLKIATRDEVEDLANSFNHLQDEILAAQKKQRDLQAKLRERNRELKELYEKQKDIALVLQESLLPKIARSIDHLLIGFDFQSATEAALVGGDFFDFIEISEKKFGIAIGDVSGKGIEAATLATTVRNTLRAFSYEYLSPAEIIEKTNKIAVAETQPSTFVTLFFGIFDVETHELTYAIAGHWPPLIYHTLDKRFTELEIGGLPIGISPTAKYLNHVIKLPDGSIIVLYTDGVIESRLAGELFGVARLRQVIEKNFDLPPTDLSRAIINEAKIFGGGKLFDDAAVLVVRVI
ncbi:MAG: SpoIIE family protein phosphatase [Actinomycetota bacterium]